MEELKNIILKRVQTIDLNLLCDTVDKLESYGVNFYNRSGKFIYEKFQQDCINTCNLLSKKDIPNLDTGIKYKLCDFMSAVQSIVGIRNMAKFMSSDI